MNDTHTKKIVILYRACVEYTRSSVQSTVRFLAPRVYEIPDESYELSCARQWWKELDAAEKQRLDREYMFAAKH
jgi:hypothetical protein